MDERRNRVCDALADLNADWAVFTGFDSIAYATGIPQSIEWGPSPFSGGQSCAIVGRDGRAGLVLPNHEMPADRPADLEAVDYVGFSYLDGPQDLGANYARAVAALVARLGVSGRVAVERSGISAGLLDLLPAREVVDIAAALRDRRAVKTELEIAALTRAAEVAAIGQRTARVVTRPGICELDAFAEIRLAMETAAGGRCALAGDFVSGAERTAVGMGWPDARRIRPGDSIVCDLAPRVNGYWGDSCAGFVLGAATQEYRVLFDRVKSALTAAMTLMTPGKPIGQLDREMREMIEVDGLKCHHHLGHSIGTSVHEWPRIIPNEPAPLREGMVLMVEPACYQPGLGGIRLEYMLAVTATGARPLAPFEHNPEIDLT